MKVARIRNWFGCVSVVALGILGTELLETGILGQAVAEELADAVGGAQEPTSPAEWYGAGVRPTEALSPTEEAAGFRLSPGYEVRLFAAEPEIAKPMNLAFDSRGRMWVTDSFEYPYPAKEEDAARDCVRILEDTDGDGRADKATIFADGLNIPIGVLPYGEGCLCFSIPNIYYLRDTDNDGVCDRRDVVLGPFDTTRDTHGMINSMRMGADGWVYANHGFNNQSKVAGKDGHQIEMQSGNTFRFRPDGSRVEQVTWGQVNPFGRATDSWGYDYTADCHSKPISQLIRDGYYPSFGRPHDGLGFVPSMMDHLHGSTAIAGLIYVDPALDLPGLAGQMISGNVMTSRLNRNRVNYVGSTAKAEELGDFLTSDDPWYRPVDLTIGPDGFIYVADFYNKIIGHYEVALDHPGRDRFRGRIWQIRPSHPSQQSRRFTPIDAANVVNRLADLNPTVRMLALQYAVEHPTKELDLATAAWLASERSTENEKTAALNYRLQRETLSLEELETALNDRAARVRITALRALVERQAYVGIEPATELAVSRLGDENPHVVRMAAEALGQIVGAESLNELLVALDKADSDDVVMQQSIRIAIRNQVRGLGDGLGEALKTTGLSIESPQADRLSSIILAVQTPGAGRWVLDYLQAHRQLPTGQAIVLLEHATRCLRGDASELSRVLEIARATVNQQRGEGWRMLQLVAAAIPSDSPGRELVKEWAAELTHADLKDVEAVLDSGRPLAIVWRDGAVGNWPTQMRRTINGADVNVTSSFPLGEPYVGRLVSDPFPVPATIEFWIAGHNGYPDQADHRKNRAELIDAATGTVLHVAYPPRNDALVPIKWDCRGFEGRQARLQLIDEDSAGAYAWFAVGAFAPDWLQPAGGDQPLARALQAISTYDMNEFRSSLKSMLTDDRYKLIERAAIGETLAKLEKQPLLALLYASLADAPSLNDIPSTWLAASKDGQSLSGIEELTELARRLDAAAQLRLAQRLASGKTTAGALLEVLDAGAMGADVLLDKNVSTALEVSMSTSERERFEELLGQVKQADQAAVSAMDEVLRLISEGRGDAIVGRQLFEKQCAVCHQLAGKGEVVGPQLDGVGGRGSARLLEDIMMPDRNVDRAFRVVTVLTLDGQVKAGLPRAEVDGRIQMVGNDGKPFEIAKDDIDEMRTGINSLMPSNFYQTMKPEEIAALVRFLSENATQAKSP